MRTQLITIKKIPKRLRGSHCIRTQYESDGTPTEDYDEAMFEVTIHFRPGNNLSGYMLTYCRHHLAQFVEEVDRNAAQALRRGGR